MTERPRRPILHLKLNPDRPPPVPAVPAAPVRKPEVAPPSVAPAAGPAWKCKPCGTTIALADMPLEGPVRCPGCNARLGVAEDFRADPPRTERLRARLVRTEVAAEGRRGGGKRGLRASRRVSVVQCAVSAALGFSRFPVRRTGVTIEAVTVEALLPHADRT